MGTKTEKGFRPEPGSSPSLPLAPTSSAPPASNGHLSPLSKPSSSPAPILKVCWGPR